MFYNNYFDVIIIGGGHAGIEAALSSSRTGCKTLLLTDNLDTLGEMSCNPSIGGVGKSHLVKEIDALGGVMAKSVDYSGIQFRVLNSSKGYSSRSTRAQVDRFLYKRNIKFVLENTYNLILLQQTVKDIIIENYIVKGVLTNLDLKFYAKSIVISVGTFLNAVIYIGSKKFNAGRYNNISSDLFNRLRDFSIDIYRLKTGTPPRINANTINFNCLYKQSSDNPLPFFSFTGSNNQHPRQLSCYITNTNVNTHNIINSNLHLSPIYNGVVDSFGPRYCPSIEDKIIRFPNYLSHQIFLEPEGLYTKEIYPNGISTSLPFNVQQKIVNSIFGLEYAVITQFGYSVEYDFFDPRGLKPTLESKFISGLFFAGQVNGTTGYEEAASQGLLAGYNSSCFARGVDFWYPTRYESYLGVLIDDLITVGTKEPYRMFTSRAEYRFQLQEDNADFRLTKKGYELGLVGQYQWSLYCNKIKKLQFEKDRFKNIFINLDFLKNLNYKIFNKLENKNISFFNLLKYPEIDFLFLMSISKFNISFFDTNIYTSIYNQLEIQIKYRSYFLRQQREIEKFKFYENFLLPLNFNYFSVKSLSREICDKLNYHKPISLGQASRIPGVTPVSISILLIWFKKNN